jgi:HAD superfamily hydrolase (TIGR01509 family)
LATRLSQFAGVIFDMDGLLVDSEIIWHEVEDQFFGDRGHTYGPGDRQMVVGMRVDEFLRTMKNHFGLTEEVADLVADLNGRMCNVLPERVQPRPGARRLIAYLQENNVPMAVASNSSRQIIDVTMTAMDWLDTFTVRCTGDDEERGKPAPDVYLTAARILGVDPANCLGLEDSPRGAQAVVAAGMTCGAVPDLSHTPASAFESITPYIFDSLDDVCDWLQEELP